MEHSVEVLPGQTFLFRDDYVKVCGVWIQSYIFGLIVDGFKSGASVVDMKTTPYAMSATLTEDTATLPVMGGMMFTKEQVLSIYKTIASLKPNAPDQQ